MAGSFQKGRLFHTVPEEGRLEETRRKALALWPGRFILSPDFLVTFSLLSVLFLPISAPVDRPLRMHGVSQGHPPSGRNDAEEELALTVFLRVPHHHRVPSSKLSPNHLVSAARWA